MRTVVKSLILTGTELPPKSPVQQGCSETGGTESGTLSPDLQTVVNVWSKLPKEVKQAIVGIVLNHLSKKGELGK